MWRFLLPAVATTALLIALFAIARGDLKPLTGLSDRTIAIKGETSGDAPAAPAPDPTVRDAIRDAMGQQQHIEGASASVPPPVAAEQQATPEGLQRQIAELQRQSAGLQAQLEQRSNELAERTRDVAAARAESGKLQQSIDALHVQRLSEEELLARLKAQEKPVATTATTQRSPPRPTSPVMQAVPASSTAQQVLAARRWLEAGRPDEARRVLAMVQTQMVLRPVTPDRPAAAGNNPSATDVGNAIRWLDIGASGQAMQAIDQVIGDVQAMSASGRQRSGYSAGPPPFYGAPGMQTDHTNNGMR